MPQPPPAPARAETREALDVNQLTVAYGRSVRALHEVSLRVPAGGIVALLGANGAGKSTLLRAVSGTLPLHQGAVVSGSVGFGSADLTGRSAAQVVAAGVVQVPEGRRVFAELSVEDNLRAGRLGLVRRGRAEARATLDEVYALFPVLAERRRQTAGLMSGGEQQMLAMGRALMARPRLLLLDEPTLGLAPLMVERISETVQEIRRRGTGVLLVEQNAALALELADHAYVLEVGAVRLSGPAAELAASDEVRRLYLGEQGDEPGTEDVPASVPALGRWQR
ncbi:ABC transporter ATP-binding protein [Streptacidiphilus jiangxiensis]|uniref:Branched-chain amino acid transport system ATP-binding protein n=1 Tax=Streptacidiphilus jiangxiensis TaxID=235985 RepID=A0A1H7T5Y3_STRJI|nr:ABC transporter ATP-binding protein [Streptacidiphilus jiangxiensis]SEL79724.1 branched-chain amino acid transport system ATP-binding protein [Streptacidiphilus jiangxiensis]